MHGIFDVRGLLFASIAIVGLAALPRPANSQTPFTMVTESEARLPNAATPVPLERRDLFPPPDITQISPAPNGRTVRSPFPIELRFTPHNESEVDISSVRLTYLKQPSVDLTPRLRPFIKASGLSIPAVKLPRGVHTILVTVGDTDDNKNQIVIRLSVE